MLPLVKGSLPFKKGSYPGSRATCRASKDRAPWRQRRVEMTMDRVYIKFCTQAILLEIIYTNIVQKTAAFIRPLRTERMTRKRKRKQTNKETTSSHHRTRLPRPSQLSNYTKLPRSSQLSNYKAHLGLVLKNVWAPRLQWATMKADRFTALRVT
ncbi:hypothetical protein GDO78_022553 [Eleutherodactylus coqui]|uniref:Uncharacterized protein n=1 Tax=Eleutherodactylus coqui TaxID=57060 RepID=A0A8J6EFX9_ELECQ|nr:hypothetical protein GDO78_022553 [Eleutherodactylus coqui]